jgi:glycosyltransferase involved in cell wall biosynthesis
MANYGPTITIVIPTFRRPESLSRCLNSIAQQELPADEILVMVQDRDYETLNLVKNLGVTFKKIESPGIIFAIQSSLAFITTDLVAFIDDDVTLPTDWVAKAKSAFSETLKIGALGGTDIQRNFKLKDRIKVGEISAYGKLIGNHHLASGLKRSVDFLKGCNMVMRTQIAKNYSPVFNLLRGQGAQVGNDLVFSLSSRINGYETIFDPEFYVYHHVEPRKESSQRNELNEIERSDLVHNILLIKLTFAWKFMRAIVLIFQVFIGDREVPGLMKSLLLRGYRINLTVRDMSYLVEEIPKVWKISSTFRQPLRAIKNEKS